MPVLPLAPRRQPWVTTLSAIDTGLVSTRSALTFEASPTLNRRWMPTLSLVAAAVVESSPVSPTVQRPSNEVVGGAFVGAFLGFLLILLLIRCCRGRDRDRDGSDKTSSSYSPPSSPRAPPPAPPQPLIPVQPPIGPGPVQPLPVYAGPFQPPIEPIRRMRPQRAPSRVPTTQKFIAKVEGEPMLVLKRQPTHKVQGASNPRRPGRHRPVEIESSTSASYDDRTSGSVCTHTSRCSTRKAKRDTSILQIQLLRSKRCVYPDTRLPAFGENFKQVKPCLERWCTRVDCGGSGDCTQSIANTPFRADTGDSSIRTHRRKLAPQIMQSHVSMHAGYVRLTPYLGASIFYLST
jgi:hypothetical protein